MEQAFRATQSGDCDKLRQFAAAGKPPADIGRGFDEARQAEFRVSSRR
jgi:hypothetical protein